MSDPDYTIPISNSNESASNFSGIEYGYKLLNSGDIVGNKYRIIRELGSGGFATTYLAIDLDSGDQGKCVVKQLQPRFNSQAIWESAKDRFAKEAIVLQWLGSHDQIPQLLAHFEENHQFYLIQEFIEGEELEQEVQRQVLNEAQVIAFLCDVLKVLDFVHQQGVIHRDIKPSNLIRRKKDGKIVLIDFGAVKEIGTMIFDQKQDTVQTQVIGTPGYMAPEQNNGKPVYSSDIYALGKTAIYARTGRSPIEWEDVNEEKAVTWQQTAQLSQQLTAIIDKMTNPKPSERYHSASQVLQELKPLLAVGTIIEHNYRIVGYLGREENICSYIVEDIQHPQRFRYFLHILSLPNQTDLNSAVKQLQQELKVLGKLDKHEQIPKILRCFTDEKHLYWLQEYVEGTTLAQILYAEKSLSEAVVIDLLSKIVNILIQVHKQRIVHGNLNPKSIIKRRSDGEIFILNFGFNCQITDLIPINNGYRSPEQIVGKSTYASDIYALGMLAINALTGITPENWEKNTSTGEVIWQHKAQVSPELTAILNKMVRLAEKQRYQSAHQVLKALKKLKRKFVYKPWQKYLFLAVASMTVLIFGRSFWLQYQAILLFAQADLQLQSQQYEKAIEYYDAGLEKVRGKVGQYKRAWLGKATALGRLKRYDQMLQTCDQGLRVNQSFYFWNCRGLALEGLEKYQEAIVAYDEAIKRKPDYFEALNNRGEVYAKLEEKELAIADFKQAIQASEAKSFVPWNNLGKLYYQQRNYEQAIYVYNQAVAVKDDYLPALIGLGNAKKSLGMDSAAIETYNQAIEINSKSYEAWYGKALAEEALGQNREAIISLERAIALKPDWQAAIKALERVQTKVDR